MRRSALIFGSMLPLATCRSSAPVEPPSPTEAGGVPELDGRGEPLPAFDLDGFEPPFGRIPLGEAFVRAHGLRKVILREDVDTEDARLVDVEVTTLEYDRAGRIVRASTLDRGEPRGEIRYEYADDRLAVETHELADATRHEIRYAYDAAGRVQRVERELPHATIEEHHAYDERGRTSRITRLEAGRRVERSFVYDGDRPKRVVLRLPEGREIVTEHTYDADGRPARWVTTGASGSVDVYEFTWDARARLRTLSFTEGDVPIYRRTWAYDENGRPLREELRSFVPAMGHGGVARYEYERHGELPRQAAAAAARSERSKAELLAATVAAFRGAYAELAVVTYEAMGEGRFTPASVTVYIPEALVGARSGEELKQQACAAKQALGWECACEDVTLGEAKDMAWHSWADKRVVPLTLRFGLGC